VVRAYSFVSRLHSFMCPADDLCSFPSGPVQSRPSRNFKIGMMMCVCVILIDCESQIDNSCRARDVVVVVVASNRIAFS
jgi:hypothetical protein